MSSDVEVESVSVQKKRVREPTRSTIGVVPALIVPASPPVSALSHMQPANTNRSFAQGVFFGQMVAENDNLRKQVKKAKKDKKKQKKANKKEERDKHMQNAFSLFNKDLE